MTSIQEILANKSNDYTSLQELYEKKTKSKLLDPFASTVSEYVRELPTVSVIIPAWNAEDTILPCLSAIEKGSYNIKYQGKLQVVVVDDGSTDRTWEIIKNLELQLNITAVRITHSSRAQACNTGASVAKGEVLISCDADMLLSYLTIEHLASRYEILPQSILLGLRTNIGDANLIQNIQENGTLMGIFSTQDLRLAYSSHGIPSSMALASSHYKHLGNLKGLWMPDNENCKDPWFLCDQVFGALFCISREVFEKVGGYDESFYGWGCEDSLLAAKVIAEGYYIIPIYAASGLHVQHSPRSSDYLDEYKRNRKLFYKIISTSPYLPRQAALRGAKKRIISSLEHTPSCASVIKNVSENNDSNLINKVDTLLLTGFYDEVLQLLEKSSGANQPTVLLRKAKALSGKKKYRKAINLLADLNYKDLNLEVLTELVINYAAIGEYEAARLALNRLITAYPKSPYLSYWQRWSVESHILRGRKFLNQGFNEVAAICFDIAIIKSPNHSIAQKYRRQC